MEFCRSGATMQAPLLQTLTTGTANEVTLLDMLNTRELRVQRQQQLLQKVHPATGTTPNTLLSFTMNIAGPIKRTDAIVAGFDEGRRRLRAYFTAHKITPLETVIIDEKTGPEAYYTFKEMPGEIKSLTIAIEEHDALGRLFDMDVLDHHGHKTDRTDLGHKGRTCLICGGPAKECASRRTHSVEELQQATAKILHGALQLANTTAAVTTACRALLHEVATTPKPGLVDCANTGSHKDMDMFTFMTSTCALQPYFTDCVTIGQATRHDAPEETFKQLRKAGLSADVAMLAATKGVNTHKGALFSIGILLGALGRLPRRQWSQPEVVLAECAAMTKGLVASDFGSLTTETARTMGQKLYLQYGITGVRGQIEVGLPAVREVGLPTLREGLRRGLTLNEAGSATLLALITADTDTNLIARSDRATQLATVEKLRALLAENPYPTKESIDALDADFIRQNLSPGGSADLLAICYLLYFLESEDAL